MDAAALREFCHRERPPSVVLDNIFDATHPPAADALELDIGQEMTRSFGRVLDCEAILSTGVVTVYFAEDGTAQRCAVPSSAKYTVTTPVESIASQSSTRPKLLVIS